MSQTPPDPALPRVGKRPEGMSDHDYVEELRASGPVAVDRYGFYWTFSHEHLLHCTDPALTRQIETEKVTALGIQDGPVFEYFDNSLLFSNGATHHRRRRPLARTFAHRLMADLRPRIRTVAENLIRPWIGRDQVDFLNEIAGPLPARIVADILGAPEKDIPRFSTLVYSAMRALSLRPSLATPETVSDLGELDDYVTALLADRRANPGQDFLSTFAANVSEGELTPTEARVQITSVILAGSDTTRMALCSMMAQLLDHPDQWAAVVQDPDRLCSMAVAEGLRFDPVIGSLPRVATDDFHLSGVPIRSGTILAPIVLAVLRDPELYEAPDRFDVHRSDHPRYHPVFGLGAHRCLGEALARAELEETLSAIARLAPGIRLIGAPPVLRGVAGARTIDQMQVALSS